jgi:hypothetical protein
MSEEFKSGIGFYPVGQIRLASGKGAHFIQYPLNSWNGIDELGIMKGLTRKTNQSLLDFRKQIIQAKDFNSSYQGVLNCVYNNLNINEDYSAPNIIAKKTFNLLNAPTSKAEFLTLRKSAEEKYIEPKITYKDMIFEFKNTIHEDPKDTFTFIDKDPETGKEIYYYDDYQTSTVEQEGIKFIMHKDINQIYTTLIYTPNELEEDFVAEYMYYDSYNEIWHLYEEKANV